MAENINVGWGRLRAEALLALKQSSGRVFVVMPSTHANWAEVTEALPGVDPQGTTRIFATLQEAVDAAEDSANDTIVVADGYTETVTAAGGLDLDKIGLRIVGLGSGGRRPTISFSTATTADVDFDAASIMLENFIFDLTGIDALAAPLDVNAANVTIKNCEFILADSGGQAVRGIVTDADSDNFKLEGCYAYGSSDAGCKSFLRIVGGDNVQVLNNIIDGTFEVTGAGIESTTTAPSLLIIKDNVVRNRVAAGRVAIGLVEGTNVIITGNSLGIRSGTSPIRIGGLTTIIGGGLFLVNNNYYSNTTGTGPGILI